MQKLQNKTLAILIAALLTISMAASIILIPETNAHTPPWTIPTYAYINIAPNPVGVGQQVSLNAWLDKVPPGAVGQWGMRWENMKIEVTKPDGTTEVKGPYTSDPVGGAWDWYTPTQTGTYKFVFSFPGQVAASKNPYPYGAQAGIEFYNDTYQASTSAPFYLTVQTDPIATAYPANPLPTEFWARPINSMNREWSTIGGNWLGLAVTQFGYTGMYANTGNFAPYTTAPDSAHVVWTEPLAFGGQIGGESGSLDTSIYNTGTAYEAKFGPVILNGILYYTEYPGAANNPTGLKAVDIRTGETVWEKDMRSNWQTLKCGMIYNFISGDQYGAHAYLFTQTTAQGFVNVQEPARWAMYDAMTGEWILDIANATAGTLVAGQNGEILSYRVAAGQLSLWNASKCIAAGSGKNLTFANYSPAEIWRPPQGTTINWNDGYEWTVPIATNISGAPISPALAISAVSDGVVLTIGLDTSTPGRFQTGYTIDAGYSAVDGHLVFGPNNRTLPPFTGTVIRAGQGVYAEYNRNLMSWTGYDIHTGQKLWGPTEPANSSWAYYDFTAPSIIGYGNLYSWGLAGEVYCYDVKTGVLQWSYNTGSSGVDSPFGSWPLGTWSSHHILADGKLYVRAGHDYTPPVFKGAKLYCLNATTGKEIWSSLNFGVVGGVAAADGYMIWPNGYDNQLYCYAKGPTQVTVSAPAVGVSTSTPITISGTITDISAGAKQQAVAANFPNGLPCISDASMTPFMEAVYQQQQMPLDASGVPVTLSVVDSNGNYRTIGTPVSNIYGTYSYTWTPDISGDYTIIANFAGTNSYYPSTASAAFHASQPAATSAPTNASTQSSASDMYLLPGIIGIIIAIVVGFAITILILRKRP